VTGCARRATECARPTHTLAYTAGPWRPHAWILQSLLAAVGFCLLPAAAPTAAVARGRKHEKEPEAEEGLPWAWAGMAGIVSQQDSKNSGGIDSAELDAFVNSMAALWRPIATNIGLSGALGMCSAAALKVGGWQAGSCCGFRGGIDVWGPGQHGERGVP
jgi:hypothetical protein